METDVKVTRCFDPGKSTLEVVDVVVSPRGREFRVVGAPFSKPVPPLNTLADVSAMITEELQKSGTPVDQAVVAMTFPLPVVDGLINGREGMGFFDKQTPGGAEEAIRSGLGLRSFTLKQDSVANVRYAQVRYKPAAVFAVLGCGTSFAFTMAAPSDENLFDGTSSTFSHIEAGGDGPKCGRCHGFCVGAWYQWLYKEKKSTVPAILRAVGLAARLPITVLYVTGGALADRAVLAALRGLTLPLVTPRIQVMDDFEFSCAVGAAL